MWRRIIGSQFLSSHNKQIIGQVISKKHSWLFIGIVTTGWRYSFPLIRAIDHSIYNHELCTSLQLLKSSSIIYFELGSYLTDEIAMLKSICFMSSTSNIVRMKRYTSACVPFPLFLVQHTKGSYASARNGTFIRKYLYLHVHNLVPKHLEHIK